MCPVFTPPALISCFSDRLHLHFQSDEMGNAATSVLPTQGDKIVYTWVVGQVGPFLHFWFNLNPTKRSIFEKNSPPMFLEFDLVFYIVFFHIFIFSKKLNLNSKNQWFLNSVLTDPVEFWRFLEKSTAFLNPTTTIWKEDVTHSPTLMLMMNVINFC
jgi:hypothetical protein